MRFQHPLAEIAMEITGRRNVVSLDAHRDRIRRRRLCVEIAEALGDAWVLTPIEDEIGRVLASLEPPK